MFLTHGECQVADEMLSSERLLWEKGHVSLCVQCVVMGGLVCSQTTWRRDAGQNLEKYGETWRRGLRAYRSMGYMLSTDVMHSKQWTKSRAVECERQERGQGGGGDVEVEGVVRLLCCRKGVRPGIGGQRRRK